MFLPFEGLYSEVVNMGLVEVLQREYKVNIAGPSTMAALLNSLQMGFKTLAVQKRSAEVWKILGGVKTEFDKFNDVLVMTQQRLDQANKELDKLVGVRTRQIQRQLKDVESVPLSEQNLLNKQKLRRNRFVSVSPLLLLQINLCSQSIRHQPILLCFVPSSVLELSTTSATPFHNYFIRSRLDRS